MSGSTEARREIITGSVLTGIVLIGLTMMFLFGESRAQSEANREREIVAILGATEVTRSERDFSGAKLVAVMGSCQLDLTRADIAHGPAVIEAVAFQGRVQILIPERWEVVNEARTAMGGKIRIRRGDKSDKQLIVRGTAVAGLIEVRRRAS